MGLYIPAVYHPLRFQAWRRPLLIPAVVLLEPSNGLIGVSRREPSCIIKACCFLLSLDLLESRRRVGSYFMSILLC